VVEKPRSITRSNNSVSEKFTNAIATSTEVTVQKRRGNGVSWGAGAGAG